jgi:hypothetical protein
MSTLTKPKAAARKTVSKPAAKRRIAAPKVKNIDVEAPLPLPPAKTTVAALLRSLNDGSFDAAAAKGDWAKVELAYRNRSSSRLLRKSA